MNIESFSFQFCLLGIDLLCDFNYSPADVETNTCVPGNNVQHTVTNIRENVIEKTGMLWICSV